MRTGSCGQRRGDEYHPAVGWNFDDDTRIGWFEPREVEFVPERHGRLLQGHDDLLEVLVLLHGLLLVLVHEMLAPAVLALLPGQVARELGPAPAKRGRG